MMRNFEAQKVFREGEETDINLGGHPDIVTNSRQNVKILL